MLVQTQKKKVKSERHTGGDSQLAASNDDDVFFFCCVLFCFALFCLALVYFILFCFVLLCVALLCFALICRIVFSVSPSCYCYESFVLSLFLFVFCLFLSGEIVAISATACRGRDWEEGEGGGACFSDIFFSSTVFVYCTWLCNRDNWKYLGAVFEQPLHKKVLFRIICYNSRGDPR